MSYLPRMWMETVGARDRSIHFSSTLNPVTVAEEVCRICSVTVAV